jgi:hypothetical protein
VRTVPSYPQQGQLTAWLSIADALGWGSVKGAKCVKCVHVTEPPLVPDSPQPNRLSPPWSHSISVQRSDKMMAVPVSEHQCPSQHAFHLAGRLPWYAGRSSADKNCMRASAQARARRINSVDQRRRQASTPRAEFECLRPGWEMHPCAGFQMARQSSCTSQRHCETATLPTTMGMSPSSGCRE